METVRLAKIIRVKSCHLEEITKVFDLQDALDYLNRKQFSLIEESSDGFFVTYENPCLQSESKSTLVYFNAQGYFLDASFSELKSASAS